MAYTWFKKLEGELAQRPGVQNPGALAAFIGRKDYGKQAMQHAAATGTSLRGHAKKHHGKKKPAGKPSARDQKIAMFVNGNR